MVGLLLLFAAIPDTIPVRAVPALPRAGQAAVLGEAAVSFGGGRARLWLVRAGDTVGLYVAVRDPEPSLADELVISLDPEGDAAAAPAHDDFQWQLRRVLDSSVVYRGRGGRWAPPRDDPDWRLGPEHSGGGWEVEAAETGDGWCVLLRLDPAWLAGAAFRRPRLAVRLYVGEPGGWYAWPPQGEGAHPTEVERAPSRWIPIG